MNRLGPCGSISLSVRNEGEGWMDERKTVPGIWRLDGRAAIVTGGGGLGTPIAHGLIASGASVLIADRDGDRAERLADELRAAGGDALAMQVDVLDEAQVDGMVQRAVDQWGRLDILINTAGGGSRGLALGYDRTKFDEILTLNVTGTFLCCRAAVRVIIPRGDSRIVNFPSIAGLIAYPGNPAYIASKGGVVQITRSLSSGRRPACASTPLRRVSSRQTPSRGKSRANRSSTTLSAPSIRSADSPIRRRSSAPCSSFVRTPHRTSPVMCWRWMAAIRRNRP